MKPWSIILLTLAAVGLVMACSESLSADTDSSSEGTIEFENFEFEQLESDNEVSLVSYVEPKDNPPMEVSIPETITVKDKDGTEHTYTVVQIGMCAFKEGQSVKKIVIPKSIKTIELDAFSTDSIESFEVDEDSTYFFDDEDVLFDYTFNLVRYPPAKTDIEYTVPTQIRQINEYSFSVSKYLQEVCVGERIILIGDYAFNACSALTTVTFNGSGPNLLGMGAFCNCTSLKSISLPTYLMSIGDVAFSACSSLETIKIPSNVTYIGEGVLSNCTSLKTIEVEGNSNFAIYDHALCTIDSQSRCTKLIAFPAACTDSNGAYITSFTIADTISEIDAYAFSNSHIKNLTLSSSMTVIGMMAFAGMTSLECVDIPKTIAKIDYGAFTGCTSLKSIDVGVNTYTIEALAFAGCSSLTSITLHENLNTIGSYAFESTAIKSIIIPSSVTSLGPRVFESCSNLTSIEIYSRNLTATNAFDMSDLDHNVTIKCYTAALKDLGTVSDNVILVDFEKRTFPMMNIVGIAVCLLLLFVILNFLRRI